MDNDEADSLPQLTDKQHKFVRGKAKGLSNSDAYRQAYDTSGWTAEAVWVSASRLSSNPKVKLWLEYARREAVSKLLDETSYTLEQHIAELDAVIKLAVDHKSYGPALNAIVSKGKAVNLYTEHKQVTVHSTADLKMLKELRSMLGDDAYKVAASNLGYEPSQLESLETVGPEQ